MRNCYTRSQTILVLVVCLVLAWIKPAYAQSCVFEAKPGGTTKAQALAQDAAKVSPCVTVPGLSVKSLTNVFAVMLTNPKSGGKRFDSQPPAGLPEGKLMLAAQGVEFKLQLLGSEGVTGLQVKSKGTLVFGAANPALGSLFIPASKFKDGESYEWFITTPKNTFKASFELLDAGGVASVKARFKSLDSAGLSPQVRLLYAAAIFDEAELYLDRDQALEELRRQVNQ